MNLYAYCINNPLNWLDPWGLDAKEVEVEEPGVIDRIRGWLRDRFGIGAPERHPCFGSGGAPAFGLPTCPYTLPGGAPSPGWLPGPGWRPPVNPNANYYNPSTREYLRYDTSHANESPHWDYRDPDGNEWRVDPKTGELIPKPK